MRRLSDWWHRFCVKYINHPDLNDAIADAALFMTDEDLAREMQLPIVAEVDKLRLAAHPHGDTE